MSLRAFIFILSIFFFCDSAHAAQWGVLPFPKHALQGRPEDLIEAVAKVKAVHAPVYVTLMGWHDLETQKEVYDVYNRLGGLEYGAQQGLIPYFGISVINTVKRDMPDDLLHSKWDDPLVLERFSKLMETASKKLPKDIPYFIIGNEVDVYFDKHPEELASYLEFYVKAREVVKKHYPAALVGISVTMEGTLKKNRSNYIRQIVQVSDGAFFTFYTVFDLKPENIQSSVRYLDNIIAASEGKDIYLQEVGFPSSEMLGSSEAIQAEFFSTMIPAINERPQIKLASIFLLNDMEPKLCDMFTAYYEIGSVPSNVAPFREFLCTLGVHDMDGKPKAAWDVIVNALK